MKQHQNCVGFRLALPDLPDFIPTYETAHTRKLAIKYVTVAAAIKMTKGIVYKGLYIAVGSPKSFSSAALRFWTARYSPFIIPTIWENTHSPNAAQARRTSRNSRPFFPTELTTAIPVMVKYANGIC
jgi:hypothetical protein